MIETLEDPGIWIVTFMLMGMIWLQQRWSWKAGFSMGANDGFKLGVQETVDALSTGKFIITDSLNGSRCTDEELREFLADQILDQIERKKQEIINGIK